MFPSIVDFGRVHLPVLGEVHLFLPTYGLLFAVGALFAWWWFSRRAAGMGLPREPVFNLGFYGLLGGIVGAKLTLFVVEWRHYLAHPGDVLTSFRSAGVLMGGVAVGAGAFVFYARRHRLPVLALADAIVAPLALAQALGRLGCFSAGCCYGTPTDAWFGVTFTNPDAYAQTGVPLGVPLVPTQLLEAGGDLLIAALTTFLWRRRDGRGDGAILAVYLVTYAILRATIEIWRGDEVRGVWFGGHVSTSQLLSALAVAVGVGLFAHARRSRASGA